MNAQHIWRRHAARGRRPGFRNPRAQRTHQPQLTPDGWYTHWPRPGLGAMTDYEIFRFLVTTVFQRCPAQVVGEIYQACYDIGAAPAARQPITRAYFRTMTARFLHGPPADSSSGLAPRRLRLRLCLPPKLPSLNLPLRPPLPRPQLPAPPRTPHLPITKSPPAGATMASAIEIEEEEDAAEMSREAREQEPGPKSPKTEKKRKREEEDDDDEFGSNAGWERALLNSGF
ncbi:hypothetical protein Q9189_004949 [Teloschistes chrysophthalmus]